MPSLKTAAFTGANQSQPTSPSVGDNAVLPLLLGSGFRLHAGLLLAAGAAVLLWWLMSRSTIGFHFRAVGSNPRAAHAYPPTSIPAKRLMSDTPCARYQRVAEALKESQVLQAKSQPKFRLGLHACQVAPPALLARLSRPGGGARPARRRRSRRRISRLGRWPTCSG